MAMPPVLSERFVVPSVELIVNDQGRIDEDLSCCNCSYNLRSLLPSATCPECGVRISQSEEYRAIRSLGHATLYKVPIVSRIIYAIFGIFVPIISFGFAEGNSPLFVEWQSGEISDYIGLLLGGVPARPFYPFLLYAMASMAVVIFSPLKMGGFRAVRVGIYGGVVIGVQYMLIFTAQSGSWVAVLICLLIIAATLGLAIATYYLAPRISRFFQSRFDYWQKRVIFVLLIGLVLLICVAAALYPEGTLGFIIVVSLLGSPLWFFMVYLGLSVRILRTNPRPPVRRGEWAAWILGWLSGYTAAWSGSIVLAIQKYNTLPTQPPSNCYIATTAARGHRKLVGSWAVDVGCGRVMWVNEQLRTLKAGELALQAVAPRVHLCCRRIYDWCGPSLARLLAGRVGGDIAFIALLPLQVVTWVILRVVVGDIDSVKAGLYRGGAS